MPDVVTRPPSGPAVADGVRRWRLANARVHEPAAVPAVAGHVLGALPRRQKIIEPTTGDIPTPGLPRPTFDANLFDCLGRLTLWLVLAGRLLAGRIWDRLHGRDSLERRAKRLRDVIARLGGTFVKLGQQASMRLDLVPWEYCVELSALLDETPPFPVESALAAIERAAGKRWQDVYATLDPVPIGSASVACVYQAVLKDGSTVAVKVRRPGIGRTFMADLRVLDWLLAVLEWLTVVRPGFTVHLRQDLRETLLEELDFAREANFQDIFRRRAGQRRDTACFTAPRVYFDLSNDEVLVQELVTGMWLWEVLSTIEGNDPQGRALMGQLGIDAAVVARNILRAAFWGMSENLFFHADPHPANVMVGPGGQLTFIDFGSCGSFNEEQRWATERSVACMRRGDVEGMSRATLRMFEPFPPMDISPLMREARAENSRMIRTLSIDPAHTSWWERTSASQWLSVLRTARRHFVPVNLRTLRIVRATLLYDTLALRLDPTIDRYREYETFRSYLGVKARARWQTRMRDARRESVARIGELLETSEDVMERARYSLASPVAEFASIIDKGGYALAVLSRMVWSVVVVTAIAGGVTALAWFARTGTAAPDDVLITLRGSTAYGIAIAAIVVLNVRQILVRIRDREIQR